MKEKLSTILIILLFLLFALFNFWNKNTKTVLKVITPTMFKIDLNNNGIADDNETICIPKIQTYTSNLTYYDDLLKGLSFNDGISLGYLADEFAHTTLENKRVKLKFTNTTSPQCRTAEIFIENKNYSDLLKNSGFAILNGTPLQKTSFNEQKEKAKKLELVIYNHKSDKYHKLNCKYGKIAHDAVVLSLKDINKGAKACKFCHIDPQKTKKTQPVSPNIITQGNLKVILTDYTKILKPDKKCSNEVCREFVSLVNNAKNSIDIALYGWTTIPEVKQALDNALSRGLKIRIVYDTKTKGENYYPDTKEFVKNFTLTRSDKIDGNSQLTNALMHNKFAIVDGEKVFTGSMNFSETGFSGFNQNSIVIINSKSAAQIYKNEFEQMFSGKFHTLKTKTKNQNIVLSDGTKITILFSPQDKGITNTVIHLVNSAKNEIYIPAFLITHKGLTNALLNAHKRGVTVRLIIDATNTNTRNSTLTTLRSNGIPVKVENYAGKMHSKIIIIDKKYVITGSTNFSNSGENKNDENMIIIENQKIAKFYADFFEYLWSKIPDKYLKFNPPAESKYSVGSCTDGVDNDFDDKIDTKDEGCH